jgi:hypothetical protein
MMTLGGQKDDGEGIRRKVTTVAVTTRMAKGGSDED